MSAERYGMPVLGKVKMLSAKKSATGRRKANMAVLAAGATKEAMLAIMPEMRQVRCGKPQGQHHVPRAVRVMVAEAVAKDN